jgi:glucose 1-dehydrogenase
MAGRLAGRVALITGGGRGIGRGIALCLAEEGADIAVNDLAPANSGHNADAIETARLVRTLGRRASLHYGDVSDPNRVEAIVAEVVTEHGGLDIAVANAAISIRETVTETQWEHAERTFAVTQFGALHTCRAAARQMVRQGRGGKIVIIGSIMAEMASPASSAYAMAKAALNQLCRTLAAELAPYRINVNIVNPGYIDTPGERAFASEEELARWGTAIPWGRLGTARDIGRAVTFFTSDDADYITGSALRVDGGYMVGLRLPPPPQEA